jgi:hypothetical protein
MAISYYIQKENLRDGTNLYIRAGRFEGEFDTHTVPNNPPSNDHPQANHGFYVRSHYAADTYDALPNLPIATKKSDGLVVFQPNIAYHKLSFHACSTPLKPASWDFASSTANHTALEHWENHPDLVIRHEGTHSAAALPCNDEAFLVTLGVCDTITPTDAEGIIREHRFINAWELTINTEGEIYMTCTNPDMPMSD